MTWAHGTGSHSQSLPVGSEIERPVLQTTGHTAAGWVVDNTFRPFKRGNKEPGSRSLRPHHLPAASPSSSSPLPWQPLAAAGADTQVHTSGDKLAGDNEGARQGRAAWAGRAWSGHGVDGLVEGGGERRLGREESVAYESMQRVLTRAYLKQYTRRSQRCAFSLPLSFLFLYPSIHPSIHL